MPEETRLLTQAQCLEQAVRSIIQQDLNGKQSTLGFTPENVGNKDTDTALAANSDVKYPSQKAVRVYVMAQIAALVNSAPETLNQLNEIAAALGNDPNFATTILNLLSSKLSKTANLSDLQSVATALVNLGLDFLVKNGDGTKVLHNDGTYKTVQAGGGSTRFDVLEDAGVSGNILLHNGTEYQNQNPTLLPKVGLSGYSISNLPDLRNLNGNNMTMLEIARVLATAVRDMPSNGAGGTVSPPMLTGGADPLSPATRAEFIRIDVDADMHPIQSLNYPTPPSPGEKHTFINISQSGYVFQIRHENAADPKESFVTADQNNLLINPRGSATVMYDDVSERWRVISTYNTAV